MKTILEAITKDERKKREIIQGFAVDKAEQLSESGAVLLSVHIRFSTNTSEQFTLYRAIECLFSPIVVALWHSW